MIIRGKNKSTGNIVYLEYISESIIWNDSVYRAKILCTDVEDILEKVSIADGHILNTIDGGYILVEDIELVKSYKLYLIHKEDDILYYFMGRNETKVSYKWTTDRHSFMMNDLKRAKELMFEIYGNKDIKHILPYRRALNISNSLYLECE